jgi:predicted ATP-binding protein involved in virulence
MRVRSIDVKGLFGVFNHEIPINSAERVTIIHGPNGFGKTVTLRMIAAVAEGTNLDFSANAL